MKRFFLLSLLFIITASNASAQVRIEKRRYGKGWYISLGEHKSKKTSGVSAKIENTFDNATESKEVNELAQAVASGETWPAAAAEVKSDTNVSVPVKTVALEKQTVNAATAKAKGPEPIFKNQPEGFAGELNLKMEKKRQEAFHARQEINTKRMDWFIDGTDLLNAFLFAVVVTALIALLVYLSGGFEEKY